MIKTYKDYIYLYETHLHTSHGSACGKNTGAQMAEAAKNYGYAGIIVTEHNWGGNTCINRELPWNLWVDRWCEGYVEAKAYGRAHDLDVFWGYEAGYNGTEFLIYGITPKWLIEHPEMRTATIEEQYRLIHEAGGMVIHAHPYREETYIPKIRLYPQYVDGIEGINATHSNPASKSHNDPAFDERAIAYADKYHLPVTAGSDIHTTALFGGGVLFKRRLTSIRDYIDMIKGGDYMLTNGVNIYDRHGHLVEE